MGNQTTSDIESLQDKLIQLDAVNILNITTDLFPGQLVFASSMGLEDQVLMDMICRHRLDIPVFTLDTGRLFNETYELLAQTEEKYQTKIRVYFPDFHDVQQMTNQEGINLFYGSIEKRKMCCRIRKLEPLKRALGNYQAWICGLRRSQSDYRGNSQAIEWDSAHQMFKINPLINWSEQDVWDYIKANNVPYNKLHDRGYPSIGCACCTRSVEHGESSRSGRWWWEEEQHKECGLHFKDGKLVRQKEAEQEICSV